MMNKQSYFVKTTDPETAKALREAGFPELEKEGNRFVFLNQPKNQAAFSQNNKKMHFTDVLTF